MTKRKRYFAEFKAKMALEGIRKELATAEPAGKCDIHPTMISGWQRGAVENMAAALGGTSAAGPQISACEDQQALHRAGFFVGHLQS